jgi:hypothetical protein
LTGDIDRALAGYDACADDPSKSTSSFCFFPPDRDYETRKWNREGGGVFVLDSPSGFFDVLEVFDACGIRQLVTEYLGERPAVLAKKWTFRCVAPSGDPDWHQDGAFMGENIRAINVWLSLSRCGQDAPGLDLVPRRLNHVVGTGTDGARFDWTVGPDLVQRLCGDSVARPSFEPGDALLFDHYLLHRTGVHPGMTRSRYAIEAWFAASSSYPSLQEPILY